MDCTEGNRAVQVAVSKCVLGLVSEFHQHASINWNWELGNPTHLDARGADRYVCFVYRC